MTRAWSSALGIGLLLVWIAGLSYDATPWLTWLDGVAALFSFGIAGYLYPGSYSNNIPTPTSEVLPVNAGLLPTTLGAGLFVLWIVGLATQATLWLSWWTFAFSVAYLVVGLASRRVKVPRSRMTSVEHDYSEEENRRRSA
jgi:hypothetical protein